MYTNLYFTKIKILILMLARLLKCTKMKFYHFYKFCTSFKNHENKI